MNIKNKITKIRHFIIVKLGGFIAEPPPTNENIKGVFNYAEITQAQKDAVEEIVAMYKNIQGVTPEEFEQLIKLKFNINDRKKYDLDKSKFYNICKKNNIYVVPQGYMIVGEGLDATEYPILSICEDVRKLEEFIDDIRSTKE
jgi:hypothetical protein